MGDTIPITPPTGFLGAGRTTLLDCLPDRPGLADAAVVIDGFGGVGLDHSPVETPCDEGVLSVLHRARAPSLRQRGFQKDADSRLARHCAMRFMRSSNATTSLRMHYAVFTFPCGS